jgi:flagellar L-ring protein precursor FlgH
MTRTILLLTSALALAGCATIDDLPPSTGAFDPVAPAFQPAPRVATGGIYRAGTAETLLGRVRRFQPGDVLTVLLNESTQAARATSGNVSRESTNDVIPSGLTSRLTGLNSALTGLNLNAAKVTSEGGGRGNQSASLTGAVTVSVVEVQANGNLVVRGEKYLSLDQGSEVIQVSGIVRPEDVASNNTVQSRRLAHARFTYQGGGELASASKAGWGTRSLLKFWPF